ncbi:MAG: dicarboxylate/amino acid:cation symporter [Clostridia bacterium]|nr:dicarboxylate/amino acid:cation symporter [Clostridia bacterium]
MEEELNAATVDACSALVQRYLTELKLPHRDVLRYAMTVEEILLKTMETAEEPVRVHLNVGTRLLRPYLSLEISGRPFNVYADAEQEQGVLGSGLLTNLGLSPDYAYSGNKNVYAFRIRRRSRNPIAVLLVTLAAAISTGVLGLLLPAGVRENLMELAVSPLHDLFLTILGSVAGPMVFLSVAWGIYGIGDAATFKRIGKKMLFSYISTVYLIVAAMGMLLLPLFRLTFSNTVGGASEITSVIRMLLDVFPKDCFTPFIEGNTLQIIFLAEVIGIALLFLGQKTNAVAKAVEQINYIVQFLIEFISRLVPFFIFIVLVQTIWAGSQEMLLHVGKLMMVFAGAVLLMAAALIVHTAVKNRVSVLLLVKKELPAFFIAITTASSAAAFGTNLNVCRTQFGIEEKLVSFGLPLGIATFKPSTAINYMIMSLYFAENYDVEVSVVWIVIMLFMAGILSLATPPIPGGALTAYTVLFSQLGIPVQALAVALACDAIFDFVCTGFDQLATPLVLLNQAGKLGMVDTEALRKR